MTRITLKNVFTIEEAFGRFIVAKKSQGLAEKTILNYQYKWHL